MAGRLPDPFQVANTKLSQEWSANRCVTHINEDWLDRLLADERFNSMESMVKVRLILAGIIALNQPSYQENFLAQSELQQSLQRLQQAASIDSDEWVKIMASAAGQLDGKLHLEAVMQRSAVVQETVTNLQTEVQQSNNQHMFPPLEDIYLGSTAGAPPSTSCRHFQLRRNPRVQPLTTGVSYAAATPPPVLHSPRQGAEEHTANPSWIRHKMQKADLVRTTSLAAAAGQQPGHMPAPAAAATGTADAPTGPTPRSKPAVAKSHKLQMLGAEEQEEMNKLIKQQSARKKDVGHGLALRRTENVEHLVANTVSTRVRHADYATPSSSAGFTVGRFKNAGLRLKKGPQSEAAAAAAAAESEDDDEQQERRISREEDDYYTNVRENEDDDFIVRGNVDYRMQDADRDGDAAAEAMYGVTGAIERDIDELFEDSESDKEQQPAITGISRSGMKVQHHRLEHEQTPDELMDDMDVDFEHQQADGMTADVPSAAAAEEQHAPATVAKRRRVLVDDDEEDDD